MKKNFLLICLLLTVGTANAQTSPGGVSANLRLWLKANSGITATGNNVGTWADQSTNALNFTQATTSSQPVLVASAINGNPAVNFSSKVLSNTTGITGTTSTTDINVYAMVRINSAAGNTTLFQQQLNSPAEFAIYLPYSNTIYWRPGGSDLTTTFSNIPNNTSAIIYGLTASTTIGQTVAAAKNAILINGKVQTSASNFAAFTGITSSITLGNAMVNDDIAEVIVYNGAITAAQQNQIQSYLAIKYGVTLDQTTPTDYVNSIGTTVWSASNNSAYNKNIFGIGMETSEGFSQAQSKSNTSNRISIANPSAFTSGDYLVLSDTGATSFTPIAKTGLPNSLLYSSAVVWRVSKTGSVGTVDISIMSTATNPKLMVDNNNDGIYDVSISPTSVVGNTYKFAAVTLTNGNIFTLGYDATSVFPSYPGGVAAKLKWWLKANAGTSTTTNAAATSTWADQSGNANDATQATTIKQPLYITNAFNSNPALNFDQTDDGLGSVVNISDAPYSVFTVYGDITGTSAARRVVQGTNNWLIGPYGGKQSYYNGNWIDPQNLTITNKQPFISLGTANPATGYLNFFYVNGKNSSASPTGVGASGSPGTLGLGTSGSAIGDAAGCNVAEVIAFDRVVTSAEKSQIESYLAIKYGITIDQTTATNYINATGTPVWNANTNGVYKNNIFGIGKDVLNGFSQSQSASANTTRVSIANPTPALSDGNYVIISDNNLSAYPVGAASLPGGANYASSLIWNVNNTGYTGTVDITLISGLPNPILLIDNNNDGIYEAAAIPASNSGNNFTFISLNLSNQAKFALGYATAPPVGPGGISTNLKLWFNASVGLVTSGANVTTWTDQSANADNAATVSGTNPVRTLNAINGYPAVSFTGAGGLAGNFVNPLTSNRSTAFIVTKEGTANGASFAIGNGSNDAGLNSSALLFWENGIAATDISTYRAGTYRGNYSSIPLAANPHMYSSIFNATQNLFFSDGNATKNASFAQQNFDANKFSLGGWYNSSTLGGFSNSSVAEAILYDRDLTISEQQHVQSYLAIKYGLSLPTDYVNFANTVIWGQTTNSGYNTDIIGIGIDNPIGLSQTSVISANNSFLKINTPSALVNGDFLIIGASNTSLAEKSTDVPAGVAQRTARVWKVQTTGAPGTVTLKFYVGAFPEVTSATLSQCGLLISSTSSFASATSYTTGMALSGAANDTISFTGVSLANANYLSLALPALAILNTKWFAVPQWNTCSNLNQPQLLYLTAPLGAASAVVDQPGNASFVPIRVDITSGATQSINLTSFINNMVTSPANTIMGRGLRITVSGNKVVGYYQDASPVNFGTLPLKSPYETGLEFYVPGQSTFANSTSNCGPTNYCETIILSTVDNNIVTITPTENLIGHTLAAGAFNITLNKGESYQAQSISYNGIHQAGEHITASGNITVTYIDDYLDAGGQDNAGDQLVPVTKAGTSYVSLRTNLTGANANLEQTQLIATQDNTTITVVDGTTTTNLTANKGQRVTYTLPTGINAAYITSNNPVSAYQIGGVGVELGGGILPPIFTCSGSSSVAYFRNGTISNINADVIVPAGAEGGFTVNGSTTVLGASDFTVVPGLPNWKYARKDITSLTTANTLLNITNNIASFHMGFTEQSAGGGDYCYFSEFATVPVDYGDLPIKWPSASANTAGCASIGGATLSNTNTTNTTSVWAGNAVDFEEVAKINTTATGDLNDDGLTQPTTLVPGTSANFSVILNSNAGVSGKTIFYRLWFDWNNDGNFANDNDYNGNPATYAGSGVSHSPVTVTVPVNAPALAAGNNYAVRLIVSDAAIADAYRTQSPTTVINVANGEVEDYMLSMAAVLPINFGDVNAHANNCIVYVSFDTKSESNSKSFIIEHSADGINFNSLHTMPGAGSSTTDKDYSYIDADPITGINYYRIKEVNNDGAITYSKIVRATVTCNGKASIEMYPNPVHNKLIVILPASLQNTKLQLLNNLGQVILENENTPGSFRLLNMSNLSSGLYVLKVISGNKVIMTQKVVKQ